MLRIRYTVVQKSKILLTIDNRQQGGDSLVHKGVYYSLIIPTSLMHSYFYINNVLFSVPIGNVKNKYVVLCSILWLSVNNIKLIKLSLFGMIQIFFVESVLHRN